MRVIRCASEKNSEQDRQRRRFPDMFLLNYLNSLEYDSQFVFLCVPLFPAMHLLEAIDKSLTKWLTNPNTLRLLPSDIVRQKMATRYSASKHYDENKNENSIDVHVLLPLTISATSASTKQEDTT